MTTTVNASNTGSGGLIQTADASGILALQTAGTTAVTVNTSQNVGIGISSPVAKLVVADAGGHSFEFVPNNTAGVNWLQNYNRTTSAYTAIVYNALTHQFKNSGADVLIINSSGYVGIGTTTPAAPLQVGPTSAGSINGYTKFIIDSSDYAVATLKSPAANFSQIIFTDPTSTNLGGINFFNSSYATPNAMAFLTGGGNERLRIDANGNVGIGTTTPAYKLDVVGTVNVPADSSYTLGAGADRYIKYRSGNGDILYSFSAGNFYQQSITSSYHAWFTGNNERVRIDSSGLFKFNSGYGSAATAYGCRAWCQYNQSPSIIGAGNITSITVIGTGDVRLNFATALVDANYSAVATTNESGGQPKWCNSTQPSTTDIRIVTFNANQSTGWFEYNSVAVFR